jgi:hypothetical protein
MSTKQNPPRKGADLILPGMPSTLGGYHQPFNFGEFARQAHNANKTAHKYRKIEREVLAPAPVMPAPTHAQTKQGWGGRIASVFKKLFSRQYI